MVPRTLFAACARHALGRTAGAGALIALAACGRGDVQQGRTPEEELALRVRARYTAPDVIVAGAWTWAHADTTFVLLDVQSAMLGLIQARADLWVALDTFLLPVGRSDVFPAAGEIGAFAFEDLTADGLPDLLGYVGDSAGTRYPVFLVAGRGAMVDELQSAAAGWVFDVEGDSLPEPVAGPAGRACSLRLWAVSPAPDGAAEGWRYLSLLPGGRLGPPSARRPSCTAG